MTSLASWFFKKRALAFGLMASGSSIGGIVLPIMIERLLPVYGYAWTMRLAAFVILGLLVHLQDLNNCSVLYLADIRAEQSVSNVTVRSRIPPDPRPFAISEFIEPLRETPFLLTTLGSFFIFLGMFLPFNYIIVQATYNGMSRNLASYLVAILNAAR